jgi:hypothetical protein
MKRLEDAGRIRNEVTGAGSNEKNRFNLSE